MSRGFIGVGADRHRLPTCSARCGLRSRRRAGAGRERRFAGRARRARAVRHHPRGGRPHRPANDELIRDICGARSPGTIVRLDVLRDGAGNRLTVKLAERPGRETAPDAPGRRGRPSPAPGDARPRADRARLDPDFAAALSRCRDTSRASWCRASSRSARPSTPEIERGVVILEINRQPVTSVADYQPADRVARHG